MGFALLHPNSRFPVPCPALVMKRNAATFMECNTAGRGRGIGAAAPRVAESDNTLRVKAWMVHQILCEEYRCPIRYFHEMDPVSELVSSLLSHRTRNADSGRLQGASCALPDLGGGP